VPNPFTPWSIPVVSPHGVMIPTQRQPPHCSGRCNSCGT
jgi:hypothetical protein